MSVKYTCDICPKEAVSAHRVERYNLSLDLCEGHLSLFMDYLLKKLPPWRSAAVDHNLSRSLMDAAVNGYKAPAPDPAQPAQAAPAKMPPNIQHLHSLVDFFIKTNKPI